MRRRWALGDRLKPVLLSAAEGPRGGGDAEAGKGQRAGLGHDHELTGRRRELERLAAHGYRNFRVVTRDGRIVQGLLESLRPDEVSNLFAHLKSLTAAPGR